MEREEIVNRVPSVKLISNTGTLTTAALAGLAAAVIIFLCWSVPPLEANAALTSKDEIRYCGPPPRNKNGEIIRSAAVLRAFKKIHPCPLTGKSDGACDGWSVDHPIPLVCGGCDAVSNMQWLPNEIKSCAGTLCKDRWERKVYCDGNYPTR
jgi:hypothetical protein